MNKLQLGCGLPTLVPDSKLAAACLLGLGPGKAANNHDRA